MTKIKKKKEIWSVWRVEDQGTVFLVRL